MSVYERLVDRVEAWIPDGIDADRQRRLSFAVWFSVSGALFLGGFGAVNVASNVTAAIALGSFVPLMLLVPVLIRYAPKPELGGHLFILNTLLVLTAASAAKGGLASSPAGWLPPASFVMVLVLGTRGAMPWIFGVAVAHGVLGYQSAQSGWPEAELGPIPVYAASRIGATAFGMWLASVFESARLRAHHKLETRRAETRQLLDNADQGFMSIDKHGALGGEHSAVVERWLGPRPAQGGLVQWAAQADPTFAEWLELGLEGLSDGVFPEEVSLAQLPSELTAGDRTLQLEVRPMVRKGRYLVILTDLTESRARQAAEEAERETARLVEVLANDRAGVKHFVAEIRDRLAALQTETDRAVAMRQLHTIKGNTALFGLDSLSSFVHSVEDRCTDTGEPPSRDDLDEIAARWHRIIDRVKAFLGEGDTIEVAEADLVELHDALTQQRPYEQVAAMVARLREEPADQTLHRIADATRDLAIRLDKDLEVVCDGGGVFLPPQRWAPFFSVLPHLVRNAVDHGVESVAERMEAGKKAVATLTLRVRLEPGDVLAIDVEDDGRGVDWDRIRAKALEVGVPCATDDELHAAVFHDGLSTKEVVTEVSGRGAGSAAVKQEVDRLGGEIVVRSDKGRGTCVTCRAPLHGDATEQAA
jgi:two-component system chemotaxis sensor kinase CheA